MKSMHKRFVVAVSILVVSVLWVISARAQVPGMINYQGRLVEGTNLVNGTRSIWFRIHDDPVLKSILYESTNTIVVVDGLYSTMIGEYTVSGNLDAALQQPAVWLEIFINTQPLSPRERILAVPYARQVHGLSVNPTNHAVAMVPQGGSNAAQAPFAVVGGGSNNIAQAGLATISGGEQNRIYAGASSAAIGGGRVNIINTNATQAVIAGGGNNTILREASFSAISGGFGNQIGTASFYANIGGGAGNTIQTNAPYATLGGGVANQIVANNPSATLAGGQGSMIGANSAGATISGGHVHMISTGAISATISGGTNHLIGGGAVGATIGGGGENTAAGVQSTIAGGWQNQATGFRSTVGGGGNNLAGGLFATIPGGDGNTATNFAFAAGRGAHAVHAGSFVWADGQNQDTFSTATNQVSFRAGGGLRVIGPDGVTLENTANTPVFLRFKRAADSTTDHYISLDSSTQMLFRVAGATRMRIASGGNVGIGTASSPTNRLQVAGDATVSGNLNVTGAIRNPMVPIAMGVLNGTTIVSGTGNFSAAAGPVASVAITVTGETITPETHLAVISKRLEPPLLRLGAGELYYTTDNGNLNVGSRRGDPFDANEVFESPQRFSFVLYRL